MDIKTLLKLANNPHFKLNKLQQQQLEEYYRSQHAGEIKHNPDFSKHDPKLPEE